MRRPPDAPDAAGGEFLLMDPTNENTKDLLPAYLMDRSYLVAHPEGRPLAGEGLAERLAARLPQYEAAAHIVLETDGLTPEEVADEIIISCL